MIIIASPSKQENTKSIARCILPVFRLSLKHIAMKNYFEDSHKIRIVFYLKNNVQRNWMFEREDRSSTKLYLP